MVSPLPPCAWPGASASGARFAVFPRRPSRGRVTGARILSCGCRLLQGPTGSPCPPPRAPLLGLPTLRLRACFIPPRRILNPGIPLGRNDRRLVTDVRLRRVRSRRATGWVARRPCPVILSSRGGCRPPAMDARASPLLRLARPCPRGSCALRSRVCFAVAGRVLLRGREPLSRFLAAERLSADRLRRWPVVVPPDVDEPTHPQRARQARHKLSTWCVVQNHHMFTII
jgi:hypothetical protein